jgi:Arc/MetJ family transcription regulator
MRRMAMELTHQRVAGRMAEAEAAVAKVHTTLDLDHDLLAQAAEALGTKRTTETVHAALREVVVRRRRAWLVRRDFSELEGLLPDLRAPRDAAP